MINERCRFFNDCILGGGWVASRCGDRDVVKVAREILEGVVNHANESIEDTEMDNVIHSGGRGWWCVSRLTSGTSG